MCVHLTSWQHLASASLTQLWASISILLHQYHCAMGTLGSALLSAYNFLPPFACDLYALEILVCTAMWGQHSAPPLVACLAVSPSSNFGIIGSTLHGVPSEFAWKLRRFLLIRHVLRLKLTDKVNRRLFEC
ncbi:hypothetical protein V8E53_008851 [Lactarius tabidus]